MAAVSLAGTGFRPRPRPRPWSRPRSNPIAAALDTDHNGILSADEIANSPAALRTLDRDGDGQLTADELRPMRREGGPERGSQP